MSVINNLRIPLFAGAGAIIIGILCLLVFFLSAGGSRGAWTALAAVVRAAGALTINLMFDFQGGSKEIATITAEYTFDHSIPQIRQWLYARSQGNRYAIEVFANVQTLEDDLHTFHHDVEKITKDMFLFSLVAYMETTQSDWQQRQESYKTSNGTITQLRNESNLADPNECTPLTQDDIRLLLNRAGNTFANVNLSRIIHTTHICLPPRSAFRVDESSLVIETPFCTATFVIQEPFLEMTTTYPGSNSADIVLLPDGKPRFETRVMGLRAMRQTKGLMAQHPDVGKYEAWSKRLVDGARAWFETKPSDESGPPWFGDDGSGDGGMFWAGFGGGEKPIWIKGSRVYNEPPP